MRGRLITNLEQLNRLVHERRAVVCAQFGDEKPLPAIVLLNQQGRVLLRAFRDGMWLYVKDTRKVVDVEFKPKDKEKTNEEESNRKQTKAGDSEKSGTTNDGDWIPAS